MSSTTIPTLTELQDVIVDMLKEENLEDICYVDILNYSLERFHQQNLNENYYGYHNLSHELVVTHNTLLASRGVEFYNHIDQFDFKHLFAAALFHDYDPDKEQINPMK